MAGKSIKYWQDKFNRFNKWTNQERQEMVSKSGVPHDWFEFHAVCKLLHEYSGTDYAPKFGLSGGGCCSRFWAGRWNTHHGNIVRETLGELADYESQKENQTILNLISTLKSKLGDKKLSADGDLNRILTVVKEKTGIDFNNVPVTQNISTPLLSSS